MKHVSLCNMHVNNISTVLYDCFQQLESRPTGKQISFSDYQIYRHLNFIWTIENAPKLNKHHLAGSKVLKWFSFPYLNIKS